MRIRWSDPAFRDFTHICDYIEQHASTQAARRIALLIYENVGTLAAFPESGRTGRKADTRELVVARLPYVVIYRVREEAVEILRILHGAQQWP